MPDLDGFLKEVDYALSVLVEKSQVTSKETDLSNDDKRKSVKVMRVNHMGEICAQGLYRGQAYTTKDIATRKLILDICSEEREHLSKCSVRLEELSGRSSYVNPLWYLSSFVLGTFVGRLEKHKSMGFIYETEEQVEDHLDEYASKLPASDIKSQKILKEIKKDETKHKNTVKAEGHSNLSDANKNLMSISSRIMKKISYYL